MRAESHAHDHDKAATAEEFVKLPPDQLAELLERDAEATEEEKHGRLIPAADVLARLRRAG